MEPTKSVKQSKDKLSSYQIMVIEKMLKNSASISYGTRRMIGTYDVTIMWVSRGSINALMDRQLLVRNASKRLILNPKWDFTALQKTNL